VNKKDFNELIRNYNVPSDSDFRKFKDIVKAYPYSQALHTIHARISIDKSLPEGKTALGIAAMYIYDRSILKSFLSKPEVENREKSGETVLQKNIQPVVKTTPPVLPVEKLDQPISQPTSTEQHELEMDRIREGFIKSLSDLQKNKETYQEEVKKSESISEKKEKSAKSKKNLSEKKDKKSPKKNQKKSTTPKASVKTKPDKKEGDSSKSNPKEIQEIIIDSFIKNPPEVKRLDSIPEKELTTEDLSRKSVIFNDDLISENLAIILNNQGKTSKAIDIYKKLIWKYPQKKTYFAARIKELENK